MKLDSSFPLPAASTTDRWEVRALASAESLKSVQISPPSPAVVRSQPAQHVSATAPLVEIERRGEGVAQSGRRHYSRRIMHHSMLLELRSAISRRKRGQRRGDRADNIDEYV